MAELIGWLLVGLTAGALTSLIVKGYGLSLLGNLAIGLVGAIIGGVLFGYLLPIHIGDISGRIISAIIKATSGIQIGARIIASIINATIGAVAFLIIFWLAERK